jgi:hypothetical protein
MTERHGTAGQYQKGCRCADCRAANTANCRRQREARKADPSRADRAGHGKTTTYRNYLCRCEECRTAWSKYMAKLRGTEWTGLMRRRPAECGTYAGYSRHYQLGGKPCDACKAARSEYARAYYRRKKDGKR